MINAYLAIASVLLGGMIIGAIVGLLTKKPMRTTRWEGGAFGG